jgi:membrane protein implicated in regulation of membrane protease activity
MAAWLLWLIAAGLFAAGEMASLNLVLVMFAGGAVGGMALALVGAAAFVQVIAFIVVTGVLLALIRPLATRQLTQGAPLQLDGVHTLIGRTARVTRPVDVDGGRIRLGADEWSARTQHSGESFAAGQTVRILQVDGATAVVGEAFE